MIVKATKESWNNTPITNPKLVNLYEIAPDLNWNSPKKNTALVKKAH